MVWLCRQRQRQLPQAVPFPADVHAHPKSDPLLTTMASTAAPASCPASFFSLAKDVIAKGDHVVAYIVRLAVRARVTQL